MSATSLVYQCPRCGATVEVPRHLIDETVTCPRPDCRQPFRVEAPSGRFVESDRSPDYKVDRAGAAPEEVLAEVHPAFFRAHLFWTLLIVAVAVAGAAGVVWGLGQSLASMWVGGLALLGVSFLFLVAGSIAKRHIVLRITTVRSVLERGFVSKETSEVRHRDARNIQVDQSFFERLLRVGDLAISSAGQDDLEIVLRGIPDPNGVAQIVRDRQDTQDQRKP